MAAHVRAYVIFSLVLPRGLVGESSFAVGNELGCRNGGDDERNA
jgi:hypothetical protein